MSALEPDERAELERLRVRVAELERERAEEHARVAHVMADAQWRTYWLDRWHVDLNQLVVSPWGTRVRAWMRAARGPVRAVRMYKRRILG